MPRERRLAFGEVAELYDRSRPSYPPQLVEDVLERAPPDDSRRALEVGAGTGKATMLFAARGVSVLALEPSFEMAAIAERNCAAYPGVHIERTDFEHWSAAGGQFPLVYSAQAWHWVAPDVRYSNARSALTLGGVLAAFWNRPDWGRCALREELDEAYARTAPKLVAGGPMRPGRPAEPDVWSEWAAEIDAAAGFERPEVRSYRWDWRYSSEEYVGLLRTHSDHIVLDPAQRERLFAAVAQVIDEHGGVLALTYLTRLCLARAG